MMRWKNLLALCAIALGFGLAQGRLYGEALGGNLSVTPNFSAALGIRAGAENVLGPVGFRGAVELGSSSVNNVSILLVALNVDALYPLPLDQGLKVDAGLGLGLLLVSAGGTSATDFAVRGLVGLEVPVQGSLALRVEPTFSYYFQAQQAAFGIVFGPRVYLK